MAIFQRSQALQAQSSLKKFIFQDGLLRKTYTNAIFQSYYQPNIFARNQNTKRAIPIFTSYNTPNFWKESVDHDFQSQHAFFASSEKAFLGTIHEFEIGETKFNAYGINIPEIITTQTGYDQAIFFNSFLAEPLLKKGFSKLILAELESLDEVESFEKNIENFFQSEGDEVQIRSAYHLVKELNKIRKIQPYILLGVCIVFAFIIAILLGNIAFMEFRDSSYLFSLLKSFGVSSFIILFHTFIENSLLGILGLVSAYLICLKSIPILNGLLNENGLFISISPPSNFSISFIAIGLVAGLAIAMLPLTIAARKQVGQILQ